MKCVLAAQMVLLMASKLEMSERTATPFAKLPQVELPLPSRAPPSRLFLSRKAIIVPQIIVTSLSSVTRKTPALVVTTPTRTAHMVTRDHVRNCLVYRFSPAHNGRVFTFFTSFGHSHVRLCIFHKRGTILCLRRVTESSITVYVAESIVAQDPFITITG